MTANHCGASLTPEEYSSWLFYFLNESPTCENAPSTTTKTISGATIIAHSLDVKLIGSNSSDFKLVELNEGKALPSEYKAYYNGWDIRGNSSSNGVCIHHPSGDVKKISFYTDPIESYTYYPYQQPDPQGKFWRVNWTKTQSGHGITEGGSSGSPLFSETGNIIGSLTGGTSSCSNLFGYDYFGKMSSHWTSNGSESDRQLKPWLDPNNTGITVLNGIGGQPKALFQTDSYEVPVGTPVQFLNTSPGRNLITNYFWEFEGGSPDSFTDTEGQDPPAVTYNSFGEYQVSLTVDIDNENGEPSKDKLSRTIKVLPNITYVSPGRYLVVFGAPIPQDTKINVYPPQMEEKRMQHIRNKAIKLY